MLSGALVMFIAGSTALFADGMVARDSDVAFSSTDLDALLRGQVITFYDGGAAEYYEDGRYTYTYANDGGTGYGYYKVAENSTICIDFVNGFARCDLYVRDAQSRLVLITEKGDRFPVRN